MRIQAIALPIAERLSQFRGHSPIFKDCCSRTTRQSLLDATGFIPGTLSALRDGSHLGSIGVLTPLPTSQTFMADHFQSFFPATYGTYLRWQVLRVHSELARQFTSAGSLLSARDKHFSSNRLKICIAKIGD
jgi:hypothetical protein